MDLPLDRIAFFIFATMAIATGTLVVVHRNPVTCAMSLVGTFLSVAGLPIPANTLDGESLIPLLTQSGMLAREALYWHYPHYHHSSPASAIRVANWKLIEFFGEGRIELYDLAHDIGESANLADENPGKAQELKLQLDHWRKSVVADLPVKNPDFDPARRQLWGRLPHN